MRLLTEEQIDDMKALYESGWTQEQIASKYFVSRKVVATRLSAMGVKSRKVGKIPVITEEVIAKARQLRADGYKNYQIAKLLNMSEESLRRKIGRKGNGYNYG